MTARCPHRRRRRHPCLPGGRHRAGPGVLGRVRHHRTDRRRRPRPAQTGVDPGLRRRWHPTRRCRRRRANQMGGPRGLAARPARHRPPGTPPGAQLRVTDLDGNRITCFVTNTGKGQLASWNAGTAAAPAAKTGAAAGKTPACETCPTKTMRPTASGWRSSNSPRTCSPGPRRCL